MKELKKESLILPVEYKELELTSLKDMGLPKGAVGFGMATEMSSCLLLTWPVSEEASMPIDDPQWVTDEQHKTMGEDAGLIEVANGVTKGGKPFIYEIIKHRISKGANMPQKVEYTLNINVKMDNSIQFINSSFTEKGVTGVRDNMVFAMYSKTQNLSIDEMMEKWSVDPYDPDFKKGFLMNISEKTEFDELFPQHPLSEARKLVKFIIENN